MIRRLTGVIVALLLCMAVSARFNAATTFGSDNGYNGTQNENGDQHSTDTVPTTASAGAAWHVVTGGDDGTNGHTTVVVDCVECPTYSFEEGCTQNPSAPLDACTGDLGLTCPPGQSKWYVKEVDFGGRTTYIRVFCHRKGQPPTDPQTAVESVLGQLPAKDVAATIYPFKNALPVTLPVYLQVTEEPLAQTAQFTGADFTLQLTLHDPSYEWWFDDDPVGLPPTTDRGGPYPTGTLTHVFKHPGKHTVYLRVTWQVHYQFDLTGVPGGFTLQGNWATRVRPANDQEFPITIVEAHAVLVQ